MFVKFYLAAALILDTVTLLTKFYDVPKLNINLFLANILILCLLKTPENFWFSGVFRGYKMGILARNELTSL